MNLLLRASTSATVLVAAMIAANPALAQATMEPAPPAAVADGGDGTELEEIVVTAQRRAESLSRVGVTVTAVGAADLDRLGISDPQDLTTVIPGFQATSSYGGQPNYTLRGVGFNARYASATSPIGLYLNEAAVPYPYMSLGLLFDLERVEALKGPQGTLYGRNATGGLLNFVTARPTDELASGFTAEAGNFETLNGSAFVSGPLSDNIRARVAVDSQNRFKGWQKSVTRDERLGELHQHGVRLSVDVGDGGPFDVLLTGDYWRRKGDTVAPQAIRYITGASPFASADARASIITNPTDNQQADWLSPNRQPSADVGIIHPSPLVDSEFYKLTGKASLEVAESVSVVSLTSYDHLRQRDVSDAAGLQTQSIYQDSRNRIRSISQELRLIGEGDALNWSLGGYYAHDRVNVFDLGYSDENAVIRQLRALALSRPQTRYTPAQISRSFINYQNRATKETEILAAFANVDYRFSDQLKLNVGGRYTRDENDIDGCTYDTNGGNVPVINIVYPLLTRAAVDLAPDQCYVLNSASTGFVNGTVQRSQSQNNFAWRINLDFTPNDATLLYATVSRGYKAGGFPVIAASNEKQYAPVRQERLDAYEVGAKLALLDRSAQLNVSAFYYDYTDKQIFGRVDDIVFTTLSRIDNVPESREWGLEADLTARLSSMLTFRTAAVYLDTKIERYAGFDEFGVTTNFAGRPFSYTPKFQGNSSLTLDTPLNDTLDFNGSVNASYQGKSHADFGGSPFYEIDGYTLVGATVGVESESSGWSAGLYVRNLFDKYYWTGVSGATETVFRYAGMPREFGVRVGFRF